MSAPNRRRVLCALVAVVLVSLACGISPLAPAVQPQQPGNINTIIALTAGAAQTQTAAVLPAATFTPQPTYTPTSTRKPSTATPTPTATVLFYFPTPIVIQTSKPTATESSGDYECKLVSQTPENGAKFSPNKPFVMTWKVKNTGEEKWNASQVDFVFKGGKNLSKIKGYDLPSSVESGGTIKLGVNMRSPTAKGTYTSTWTLRVGQTNFCTVSIKIIVK